MRGVALIGLIGGIAPESTTAYYRQLVAGHRSLHPESYPTILINSIDLTRMIGMVTTGDLAGLTTYLVDEVERLARAGATIGAFASNTPHLVFDAVRERAPIPMVSIVECAAAEAERRGYRRVGLLGTRFTMQAAFYPRVFGARGIEVVAPQPADLEYVNHVYFNELVNVEFRPETRQGLLDVVVRLHADEKVEAAILGGTELPLVLTPDLPSPVPLLDTTELHVAELLARAESADMTGART